MEGESAESDKMHTDDGPSVIDGGDVEDSEAIARQLKEAVSNTRKQEEPSRNDEADTQDNQNKSNPPKGDAQGATTVVTTVNPDAQQDDPLPEVESIVETQSDNQEKDSGAKATLCLPEGVQLEMEMKDGKLIVPHSVVKSHLLNRKQGTYKTARTIISTENFK